MSEKVNSEPQKTVFELTHVQRWEDDGGAVIDRNTLFPQAAETNNSQPGNVAGEDLSYAELKQKATITQKEMNVNPFVSFMASSTGRIVRIVAGLALLLWGRFGLSGMTALVVALIGLVPLFAGTFDFCVFAPIFGAPLSGSKIRADN